MGKKTNRKSVTTSATPIVNSCPYPCRHSGPGSGTTCQAFCKGRHSVKSAMTTAMNVTSRNHRMVMSVISCDRRQIFEIRRLKNSLMVSLSIHNLRHGEWSVESSLELGGAETMFYTAVMGCTQRENLRGSIKDSRSEHQFTSNLTFAYGFCRQPLGLCIVGAVK